MADYRKIFEDHYGIKIPAGYDIHHIDANRDNNDISNLLLIPSKLHSRYHGVLNYIRTSQQEIPEGKGKITFNFTISPSAFLELTKDQIFTILDILSECAKWADYKLFLDRKMPNIHGINLDGGD